MIQELLAGSLGIGVSWVFLYSAVYVGVKHALRDRAKRVPDESSTRDPEAA